MLKNLIIRGDLPLLEVSVSGDTVNVFASKKVLVHDGGCYIVVGKAQEEFPSFVSVPPGRTAHEPMGHGIPLLGGHFYCVPRPDPSTEFMFYEADPMASRHEILLDGTVKFLNGDEDA